MTAVVDPLPLPVCFKDDAEALRLCTELFKALDTDKTGFLSAEEIRRARNIILCKSSNVELCQLTCGLFDTVDGDHDGQVDALEWEFFVEAVYSVAGRALFLTLARSWVSNSERSPVAARPKAAVAAKPKAKAARAKAGATAAAAPGGPRGAATRLTIESATTGKNATAAKHEAASKIQSLARGRAARAKTMPAAKLQASNNVKAVKTETAAAPSYVEPKTTAAMLWDILMLQNGPPQTQLTVEMMAFLWQRCKGGGLDMTLVRTVPMHFDAPATEPPEDVSAGEVAHLCLLLIDDPDLPLEQARAALADLKDNYRLLTRGPYIEGEAELKIGLKRFRRLISFLVEMMRIDEEYIVCALAYESRKNHLFEMPDTLAALIREICGRDNRTHQVLQEGRALYDEPVFGKQLLQTPLKVSDFTRLAHDCKIIDSTPNGPFGIQYADVNQIYQRTHKKLVESLKTRAQYRGLKFDASKYMRNDEGFVGKLEICVLLDELHKCGALPRRFQTPLAMAVQLVVRAGENTLVSKEAMEAAKAVPDAPKPTSSKTHWKG
eukprot:TRINITY_DN80697_c0_g1_i1.p1 TRINITY_DN80697_c0_g1~~TRINITY_DN80697_c0_g1_i1.p1  ORF type:complete len:551 (+),score=141.51 TRINITY_DN80697_c0_g1_i1:184-1836(+)